MACSSERLKERQITPSMVFERFGILAAPGGDPSERLVTAGFRNDLPQL